MRSLLSSSAAPPCSSCGAGDTSSYADATLPTASSPPGRHAGFRVIAVVISLPPLVITIVIVVVHDRTDTMMRSPARLPPPASASSPPGVDSASAMQCSREAAENRHQRR